MASKEMTSKRVFELYIDSLEAERDLADDMLIVRLRYFSEDISSTSERLKENPRLAYSLVQNLSGLMQELDAASGGTEALTRELGTARRWALLIPENGEAAKIDPDAPEAPEPPGL